MRPGRDILAHGQIREGLHDLEHADQSGVRQLMRRLAEGADPLEWHGPGIGFPKAGYQRNDLHVGGQQ